MISADVLVGLKKRVQFVTPTAPIRPEHKENALMLLCGRVQCTGNPFRAVGKLIINWWLLCVDCGVCDRVGLRAGYAVTAAPPSCRLLLIKQLLLSSAHATK